MAAQGNMKLHKLSGGQLFISGGIYFIPALAVILIDSRIGFIDLFSIWFLFGFVIALFSIVYISVHLLPTKIAIISGICGWCAIPISLFVLYLMN